MLESMLLAALFSIVAEEAPNTTKSNLALHDIPTVTWSAPRQSYDKTTDWLQLEGDATQPATITFSRAGKVIQQLTATRIAFSLKRGDLKADRLIHRAPR